VESVAASVPDRKTATRMTETFYDKTMQLWLDKCRREMGNLLLTESLLVSAYNIVRRQFVFKMLKLKQNN